MHEAFCIGIRIRSQVYCPCCAEELIAPVTVFRDGWAQCAHCAFRGYSTSDLFKAAISLPKLAHHFSTSVGLMFYTPKLDGRSPISIIQLAFGDHIKGKEEADGGGLPPAEKPMNKWG